MGGTSTDVSRFAGQFEHVFETTTAGITIQAPQVCELITGNSSESNDPHCYRFGSFSYG